MKIRFVTKKSLHDFKGEYKQEGEQLLLFGLEGLGEVCYEKELKGESFLFEQTALLSKESKSIVVCGCLTDMHGFKRKSAVVAENGRLLGISDATHVLDEQGNAGGMLHVYETKAGRMGVLVAEDIFFPDTLKALAMCGSDFLVCIYGKGEEEIMQILLRAYAYLYGVPIFFCGGNSSMIVDMGGSISFFSPQSLAVAEFCAKKEYHLVQTRHSGKYGAKERI